MPEVYAAPEKDHEPLRELRMVTWPELLEGDDQAPERAVILYLHDCPGRKIHSRHALAELRRATGLRLNDLDTQELLLRLEKAGWIECEFKKIIDVRLSQQVLDEGIVVYRANDPNWRAAGACRDSDVEEFLMAPGSEADPRSAIKFCHSCEVAVDCLAMALTNQESAGVWGGLTPDELVKVRKEGLWRYNRDGTWLEDMGATHRVFMDYASRRDLPELWVPIQPRKSRVVAYCTRARRSQALRVMKVVAGRMTGSELMITNQGLSYHCRSAGMVLAPRELHSLIQVLVDLEWMEVAERQKWPSRWRVLPAGWEALAEAQAA